MRQGRGISKSEVELRRLKRRIQDLENEQQLASQASTFTKEMTASPLPSPSPVVAGDDNESNAMMGLKEDEHQSFPRNYSDSSAKSFTNQIKNVVNRVVTNPANSEPAPLIDSSHTKLPLDTRQLNKRCQPLDYDLPSRQRADQLLVVYRRLISPLFPFLDTNQIDTLYNRVWIGEDLGQDGHIFLCLLNVVFGLACIMDPSTPASERVKFADIFYKRSCQLLDFELLQYRSILTVQCFLLLGQYLQSTNHSQQCWIFIGLAIRIAQSLGLGLPSTSLDAPSLYQRDLLRKVWHGCILMDRKLSMICGQPAMINSQAAASVPLPTAHPENFVCNCYVEPCPADTSESSCHFFIEALKLYDLMSETLQALYNSASPKEVENDAYTIYFGSLGTGAVGSIFELNKRLRSWSLELPIYLRHNPGAIKTAIHCRQTNILWLRYCHVRILLFRPVLSRFCSERENHKIPEDQTLPWKIAFQCSISCIKAALETINYLNTTIADKKLEELDDLLPSWWYNIFYIHTAATVLLAARLQESIVSEVTESAINNAWHVLMRILKRFKNYSKHATRCAAALSVLFEQVSQQCLDQPQFHLESRRNKRGVTRRTPKSPPLQQQAQQMQHDLTHSHLQAPADPIAISIIKAHPINVNNATKITSAQNWVSNDSFPATVEYGASTTDYFSVEGLFSISEIQDFDLGDMSWLSSLPTPSYGNY